MSQQTHQLEITLEQAKLINDAVRAFKVVVALEQIDATNTSAGYRDLIGKLKTIMEEEVTPEVTPDVTAEPVAPEENPVALEAETTQE